MSMWFTKQPSGFRGWIAVVRASGQLRTGLVAGDFTVTVVAPGDGANATPSMTESSQKAGVYYFDILTAFITPNGIGEYGVVVEVDTIAGPSGAPQVRTAMSEVMRVTARDFDDLAQPGDAMALTAGERTTLAAAIWAKVADGNILGLTAEETIDLTRKILNNRLELKEGSTDNWELYDDDDVTVVLDYNVTDKDGNAITLLAGAPARRTRGQ